MADNAGRTSSESSASGSGDVARAARRHGNLYVIALVLIVLALVFGFFTLSDWVPNPWGAQGEGASPAEEAEGSSPPRWLLSRDGSPMYTVILGTEPAGPVKVEASATAVGTYKWIGDALSIEFTRTWAQDDGGSVEDPWTFECTGSPDAEELACVGTCYKWAYLGDGEVDMGELLTFDVVANRK